MKLHHACSRLAPALLVMTFAASFAAAQDATIRSGDEASAWPGKETLKRQRLDTSAPAELQHGTNDALNMALSDGQILQIVHSLNDGEIKQAQDALSRSDNAEIKKAAQMILAEHEGINKDVDNLSHAKLNLEESPLNNMLLTESEQTFAMLQKLSGAEFDCTYLREQASQHKTAIEVTRRHLIVNAKDPAVRQFLSSMPSKLENHQLMAQSSYGQANCK